MTCSPRPRGWRLTAEATTPPSRRMRIPSRLRINLPLGRGNQFQGFGQRSKGQRSQSDKGPIRVAMGTLERQKKPSVASSSSRLLPSFALSWHRARARPGGRLVWSSQENYSNRRNGPKPVSDMVSLRFLILCDSVQTSATSHVAETIVGNTLKVPMRVGAIQCRRGEITFRVRCHQFQSSQPYRTNLPETLQRAVKSASRVSVADASEAADGCLAA
jgi:hypothetical protein